MSLAKSPGLMACSHCPTPRPIQTPIEMGYKELCGVVQTAPTQQCHWVLLQFVGLSVGVGQCERTINCLYFLTNYTLCELLQKWVATPTYTDAPSQSLTLCVNRPYHSRYIRIATHSWDKSLKTTGTSSLSHMLTCNISGPLESAYSSCTGILERVVGTNLTWTFLCITSDWPWWAFLKV